MKNLHILHLANYYIESRVYKNLVSALDGMDVKQTVYTAFKGKRLTGANKIDLGYPGSGIIYRPILNTCTRINYNYKTKKITKDILPYTENKYFDIIHAHTLFSDGKVAYNLHQKYDIPYIVAIRSTDINFFFKYFPHLRPQAKKTLLSAKKIIFISHAYLQQLLAHPYLIHCKRILEEKSVVVPNGIDDYWLKEAVSQSHQTHQNPARLLYVGTIEPRKNLLKLMKVVVRLNQKNIVCVLNIVGQGSGIYYRKVKKMIKRHSQFLIYHGQITENAGLRDLYNASDLFVMPSRGETFGLVYVEALSQGIPVIYTKGEGIDGFFPPEAGETVDCKDDADIESKIQRIIHNYSNFSFDPKKITSPFNWSSIAQMYKEIYENNSIKNGAEK